MSMLILMKSKWTVRQFVIRPTLLYIYSQMSLARIETDGTLSKIIVKVVCDNKIPSHI